MTKLSRSANMDISLNSLLPVMTTDMKERQTLRVIKGFVYAAGEGGAIPGYFLGFAGFDGKGAV